MIHSLADILPLAQAAPGSTASPMLGLLVFLPFLGAIVVAFGGKALAKPLATVVAVATLAIAAVLATKVTPPAVENMTSIAAWHAADAVTFDAGEVLSFEIPAEFRVKFGLDSISLWLVLLATILTPLAMHAGVVKDRQPAFFAWLLVMLGAVLGAFVARDVLLFYVFFEVTLVPGFFLIAGWGGLEKRRAAAKFFLFTFAGSVFMLAAILYAGLSQAQGAKPSFDLYTWIYKVQHLLSNGESRWVLIGLLVGLLVKVPLVPLHTWLPATYTQAPAVVTALLSGVLAKLGTYGLLRLAIPIGFVEEVMPGVPGHTRTAYAIILLALVGVLVIALIAWVQRDFKTLVAYSSVSHLGFCVLAMMSLNMIGLQASVLYMVNHGITSAALFFMLGMIEQRVGTREIDKVSGLGKGRPWLAFFFVLFVMASIGLPLTNGFISEFLSVLSLFTARWTDNPGVGILAAIGIVLGAVYMLHLTAKLIFGPTRPVEAASTPDLRPREIAVLAPLAILVIVLGVVPGFVLDSIRPSLELVRTSMPREMIHTPAASLTLLPTGSAEVSR